MRNKSVQKRETITKSNNSELMKHILLTLITIAGRRSSSETIAAAFIDAIILSLKEKYDFLKYIEIKNITYHEGLRENAIRIKSNFNAVKTETVGEAIESIIRILCMDLEEETGLFFIKELKDRLSDTDLVKLKKCGVDLELLRLEQKHLHEQLEKRKLLVDPDSESDVLDFNKNILDYTWDAVSSFKYRNNLCFIYDKNGRLLDKLPLNKIIEYYIRTLTDFGKLVKKADEVEITQKQHELLQMLYTRDLDFETAQYLLHISHVELNHMIQELLRFELLQYVTFDEIKLTEKGVKLIEEQQETQ